MKFKEFIFIIPARKGSKGIKNKNIIKIRNKSLVEYTFETLNKIPSNRKYVLTDSEKVKKIANKYKINGVILTNTTDSNRESLLSDNKAEIGGLSGKPLRDLSTKLIKRFYKDLRGKVPIIGVGGVDSGKSAFEKISAGASALQLYTGMIYGGPLIVKKIKKDLIKIIKEQGFKNIKEAIGSYSNKV